jgi:hypothetical protein
VNPAESAESAVPAVGLIESKDDYEHEDEHDSRPVQLGSQLGDRSNIRRSLPELR